MAKKEPEFDFKKDLKTANNIKDLPERLLFLKKRLKEFNQFQASNWSNFDLEGKAKQYNEEINYVQELINTSKQKRLLDAEWSILSESSTQQSKETLPPPIANKYYQFDNRIIETIIFPDKLQAFNNIEKALFDKKYLSSEGKWITLKPLLVAFIHILIKLEYVRPIIKSKSKDNSLNYIRQYFENRYLTNITQQIKPSKFDVTKLHTYHPDFINIIPDIDLIKK